MNYNFISKLGFCSILLCASLFFITSCDSEGKKSSISLTIDEVSSSSKVLVSSLSAETNSVDTLTFDVNDKTQKFTVKINIPTYYAVISPSGKIINLLLNPNEKINIQSKSLSFDEWTMSGSDDSQKIKMLDDKINNTVQQIDSLADVLKSHQNNRNIENISILIEMNYDNLLNEQKKFNTDFIDDNINSMVSIYALFQQYPNGSFVLSDAQDLKWFVKVDSSLYSNPKFRSSRYLTNLHININDIKEQVRRNELAEMISGLGATIPEIELPNPNGKNIKLSSLRGKYVLVDFWAGWCSPCREENPNLVANYNKFSSYNFDIFQVSLDRSKKQWTDAIADDGLGKWHHVSDLQYWDSSVVELFNLSSIPYNLLIDPDGVIIAKNLRGSALEKKLTQLFITNE